jgi:outer membrane protein assembly factor BamA
MPVFHRGYAPIIFLVGIILLLFTTGTAYAANEGATQETESEEDRIETGDPNEYNIDEIVEEVSEDTTILGIVDSVELTGRYYVKESVIHRQLTFDIGDEITQGDLDLSKRRLLQCNGLFWHAEFEVKPSEEEGHISLILTIHSRRTWHITPAQSGAGAGDRNFFGTGKGVAAAYFSVDDIKFAYIAVTDPQFLGGHQRMVYEIHLAEGDIITRTDADFSSGEEYLFEKRGGYLRYGTRWKEDVFVNAALKVEDVSTEVKWDPYPELFADNTFYLSEAWIPDGSLVTWTFSLGKGSYNSAFFPTKGYTLWFNSDHSYEFLGSDFNFSRYTFAGTRYFGIGSSKKHSLAFKGEYGFATGSDIPHYELPVVDFHIRGMGGTSDRGKSYMVYSGEYRFYLWPDILQGVVFIDTGRAWDGIEFGFGDYQTSYGVGLRYQTFEHWGFNILIRADYSLGPYDQRWYIGLGNPY